MNGQINADELRVQREKEYAILNSYTRGYRMPSNKLPEYVECLERIREINRKLGSM